MAIKGLKRNILQRLFGIPATRLATNPDCWTYEKGKLSVTLAKAPELAGKGGAIRIEARRLPVRVLLYRDDDGVLRAMSNRCGHMGRRIDPVPGEKCLQCCSVMAAAYDYSGKKLEGPGDKPMKVLETQEQDGKVIITLT
jgi:nitrite reductase/ring-hydroxylating ferredoxin subunit